MSQFVIAALVLLFIIAVAFIVTVATITSNSNKRKLELENTIERLNRNIESLEEDIILANDAYESLKQIEQSKVKVYVDEITKLKLQYGVKKDE